MGIKVDRVGTFRCRLIEKGISKTKEKGLPQLVARVKLIALYDEPQKEWFGVEDWDMETQFWQCLYGVSKKSNKVEPTLSYEQVVKVFNWDGASLAALAAANHEGLEFQVRIGENTYENAKSPFQVDWIDEFDADPVYTLRKLDAKEIKDLDAQFSSIATASASKAASAPKGATAAPKAPAHPARVPADDGKQPVVPSRSPVAPKTPTTPVEDKPLTAAEKKALMKKKSARIKADAKKQAEAKKVGPKAPVAPATPPVPEEEVEVPPQDTELPLPEATEPLTKGEAWAKIFEMRDETIDDETVKALWDAAIEEVAGPGAKHADLTGEQWCQVKDIVLADCAKF